MKVKKRISLVIALMMLMTVFAVPALAYGKENKAKAAPRSFHNHYCIAPASGEEYEDGIPMDLDGEEQLYLYWATETSKNKIDIPSDWHWASENPEVVEITEGGLIKCNSNGISKVCLRDNDNNDQVTVDIRVGNVEAVSYSIAPASGAFKENPYESNYEDHYYYGEVAIGDSIDLKINSSKDNDELISTKWDWYCSDEDIVSMVSTANGVKITGKKAGIVQISADIATEDKYCYTDDITLYVGNACQFYVTDSDNETFAYMEIGETKQLQVKSVPEKAGIEDGWTWEVYEGVDFPGKVKITNNVVTALSAGDISISGYHSDFGDASDSMDLRIGYEYFDDEDFSYLIYPKNKTAEIDWQLDTEKASLTIPTTISVSSEDSDHPGIYTVTAIGKTAICGSQIKSVIVPDSIVSIGSQGIGYERLMDDEDNYRYSKIPNFIIYGYSPTSAAANYAAANGFRYINIGSKPAQSISGASSFTKAYGSKAFSLGASSSNGGALTFSSSNTKVAAVSASGVVTIKGTGKATITITAAATDLYGGGSKSVNITVTPKKVAGIKAKAGKKSMTVSWKKDTKASGYQITYAQKKNFKKGKKNVTISKNKTTKKVIKKLKSKKTYYVKVRAYKKVGKQKLYGAYSAVKKVKVK